MARIITMKAVDIVSGEEVTFSYDADAKELTIVSGRAIKVSVLSDVEE
jgi:hypothetical protein